MKKVIVFGTFDIVHPGHIHMLKEAKEYGDYLVVIVARNSTVCSVKGRAPLNNEDKRLENIKALGIADSVRLGCIGDKYQVIAEEKPDVVALGYDQSVFVDNLEQILDNHVQIVRLAPYQPDIYKSSKLRAKIEEV
ncbi:MAG: adenylyltransferase/cytidyltransferase family protein [bacterium]|nr:adenylyltransferase/cytidyltransferase family protein [bacterium]